MAGKEIPQKIIGIDILRAIAALGVFYYHNHLGTLMAKFTGASLIGFTDDFGATYAVPLFFLISGYCIHVSNIKYIKANKQLPLREYYIRRFLRIYPPYLVALVIAVGVNYLILKDYKPSAADLGIHLFALQGFSVPYFNTINVVLWTISVELAFYAIYPVFYYIRRKFNLSYALAFTLIVSCISITWFGLLAHQSLPQRFCVFNLWFAWCCGAFLADKKVLNPNDLKQPLYKVFYFLILAGFIYLNVFPDRTGIIFDQFNILFWTAPMTFVLSKENWLRQHQHSWFIRMMAAIGLSSYSLYLLHTPLINLKNYLVHQYFSVAFQLAGEIAGIAVIPVLAWYSFHFFEKPFIYRKRTNEPTA